MKRFFYYISKKEFCKVLIFCKNNVILHYVKSVMEIP